MLHETFGRKKQRRKEREEGKEEGRKEIQLVCLLMFVDMETCYIFLLAKTPVHLCYYCVSPLLWRDHKVPPKESEPKGSLIKKVGRDALELRRAVSRLGVCSREPVCQLSRAEEVAAAFLSCLASRNQAICRTCLPFCPGARDVWPFVISACAEDFSPSSLLNGTTGSVSTARYQHVKHQHHESRLAFRATHLLLPALESLISSLPCPGAGFLLYLFKSKDTDLWLFLWN